MWIALCLITLVGFSTSQAGGRGSPNQEENKIPQGSLVPGQGEATTAIKQHLCDNLINDCQKHHTGWTRCYEDRVATCDLRRGHRHILDFVRDMVNSSQECEAWPTPRHRAHIPSSALKKSKGGVAGDKVLVVATVINSTCFKLTRPPQGKRRGIRPQPAHIPGTVLGGLVLMVRAGYSPVRNLSQPIRLIFRHDEPVGNGTCVFWQESEQDDGTGHWSTDGCDTSHTGSEFTCSCNHLSFFAVLVNPVLSLDKRNAVYLNYIAYVGSALSIIFTFISLIIYICLHRRRPEKAISVHMQLTGALLCLHISFLLCCFWVRLLSENEDSVVCRILGFFLHWSVLATFSWTALEGFHLYLLLIRVFNIYVKRYLLKLSLVGWGLPTLVAVVCGISGVYGKYSLQLEDEGNQTSNVHMCWMSSEFKQQAVLVSFITTVVFPCLVILCNSCMLGVVVFKLWGLREGNGGFKSGSDWKKTSKEKWSRLWKDGATLLGLSCVMGLTWGLASTTYITYISLPGLYVFTILNSLQGVFIFLWSVALTCKSRSDNNSSVRHPSTQKMMTTSFSN
ncbi:adhesion G-protein coupled receptor G5 isoform X1 [Amphiprion ocellaris]|uniref:Adhesion G protein-coupled receptor G3 n=2 Tax=Amphiprion ocellaris TaxID=80972 RepID=A0A3Q1C3M0_AMPOC|nr:adhesion G-protein coupled receptor G5 isoform X1 [Amphiprion ocellaris]